MTGAEILRKEGEARGEARGRAKGKGEFLLRLLAKRFGPLSATVEQRIRTATLAELDAWGDLVLTANGLEDFGF